jgi:hypothetical protein
MFQRYQSLPKQVEAVRFTEENKDQVFNELTGQHSAQYEAGSPIIKVKTIHGDIATIRVGDWIVKDAEIGTYYPVKHAVFCSQYV